MTKTKAALIEQANWCSRVLAECTDAELSAEIVQIRASLLRQARRETETPLPLAA